AYHRIFRDLLGIKAYVVRASAGHIGGDATHEYHLPSKTGKDSITYCKKCNTGVSTELSKSGETACSCSSASESISVINTVEIAHTFQLGDLFAKKFGAKFAGQPLLMNCFGVGIGRLIAALIDFLSPNPKTLRLPYCLAPFKVAVILPNKTHFDTMNFANDFIDQLMQIPSLDDEIFVDDRLDNSIGRRLIGAANLAHNEEPISVGDLDHVELLNVVSELRNSP
ncbi:unnamed protein product, partial [Gongylonema pulchrum]|uniref:HGTP_anticodon domain-containing protein n=1 Tax=Gongylonema pulchrum TaxID=637853 RepID=A0A183CZ22_9BILA